MLTELTRDSYTAALSKFETVSFTQSSHMARLLEKRGFTVTYMAYQVDGDVKVAGLLYSKPMTGGLHMEMNTGPAHSDPIYLSAFLSDLQTYAKKNGALQLIIKPYDTYQTFDDHGTPTSEEKNELIKTFTSLGFSHDGLQTGYPGGEPDWLYVKDLTGLTEGNLRKSFSKKGRPLANKTSSFGIKVRRLEREELHIFKEITSSTSERREYSDKSLDYYQDFYDSFGNNCEFMVASINFQDYLDNLSKQQQQLLEKIDQLNLKIEQGQNANKLNRQKKELESQVETFTIRMTEAKNLIAKYGNDDVVLAGSLFVYTPQEAIYLFSGSYTEFNKFYAPVALQEHVMKEAIRRGITFYNFLGIQGIFDGSDGVFGFKQNFNGYVVRKMGTFRYYPKPLKYKVIQAIKKVMGR